MYALFFMSFIENFENLTIFMPCEARVNKVYFDWFRSYKRALDYFEMAMHWLGKPNKTEITF